MLGGFAEVAVAPEQFTFPVPVALGFGQGAGLFLNHHTALFALKLRGRLAEGETVLVHGAGGGVGTAAIQVANGLGARTTAVVSSDAKEQVARGRGPPPHRLAGEVAQGVEAAGSAPASAELHPDACYERSRRSLISAIRLGRSSGHVAGATPSCEFPPGAEGSASEVSPLFEAATRIAGCPERLPHTLLSGEGELMVGVRTWFCSGIFFYEANPESSARYIETSIPRRIWIAPSSLILARVGRRPADRAS